MPSSTPPSRGLPLGDRALAESPQSTTSTDGSHHPFDADDWSDESSTSNNSSSKSEGATSGKTKKKDQRSKKGGNTSQRNTNGDADAKMKEIMRNLVEEIDISQSSYQRLTSAFAASEKEKGTLLRTVQLLSRQQKEKRNERGRSISSSSSSSSSEGMEGKRKKEPTAADADDALLDELSEMSVTSSLLDDMEMGGTKADDAIKDKLARDREKVITAAVQGASDANKEAEPPLSKEEGKSENDTATRELDPSSTSTRQESKVEGVDSKGTATSEKKKKQQKSLRSAKYYRALALKALQRHRLVQQDLYAAQSELERVQEVHDAATRQQQHYEDSVYEGDPYFPVGAAAAAAAVGGGTETQSSPSAAVGVETSSSSRRARRSSLVIIDTYSDQNGLTSPHAPASHLPPQQQQQQHVSPRKVVLPSPPTVPLEVPTTGESGSLHQCSPSSSAMAPRSPYRGSIQNFAANHNTIVHDGAGLPLPVATTSPSSLSSPAQTRDSLNNNNNESTLNSDERPSVFDLAHEGALQQPQHDEDVESLFEGPSPTTATQTESPGSSVVPLHRYAAPVKLVDRSRANRASQNQVTAAATILSHRSNHPPQPSDLVANFSNGTSFVSPTTAGIATPHLRTSSSFAIDDGPSSESATTSMTAPSSATHYASSFSHPLSHGGAYAAPFQHSSSNNNNASSLAEDPFDSKLVHQHKCKEMEWLAMEEKLWLALECRGRQVRRLAELLSHSEKRNVELSTLMFDLCQQDRVARQLANSALLQRSNSAVYFGSSSSNVGPRLNLPLAANNTSNRSAQVSAMVSPATTGKSTHVSQPPPQPQPQHPLLANRPTTVFGGGAAAAASRGVLPRTSSSGIPTAKFARKSSSNSSGTGRKRSGSSGSRSSSSARRSSGSLSPSHRNQKGGGSTPKFALRPKASAMVPTPVPLRTGPVRRVIRRTSDAGLVAVSSPPSSATNNAAASAEGDVHTTLATSTSSYALLEQSANTNNNNAFTRTASATAMPAKKLKPRLVAPPLPRVATLLSGGAKQTELSGGGYAGRGLMARVPSMKLSSSGKGTSLQRALAEAAAAAAASSPKRSALLSQTDRMPPPPTPATQQAEEEGGEAAT